MITYAPTPALPMFLLVTAVIVPTLRRGPVAARRFTPLSAPGFLLAGPRSV